MIEFLIGNIFVECGGVIFQQIMWIRESSSNIAYNDKGRSQWFVAVHKIWYERWANALWKPLTF